MLRLVFVVLAGLAVLANAAPAPAQEILCTVTDAKQVKFPGDPGFGANQIPVLFLTQEISRPFDTGSGLGTGVVTHKPVTIVKELDASSIRFFMAAVSNERLNLVTCTFYHRNYRNGGGTHELGAYFKIALHNAHIVDYKDAGDGINGTAPGDERERISLTYERIELTDLDTGTVADDYWSNLAAG